MNNKNIDYHEAFFILDEWDQYLWGKFVFEEERSFCAMNEVKNWNFPNMQPAKVIYYGSKFPVSSWQAQPATAFVIS